MREKKRKRERERERERERDHDRDNMTCLKSRESVRENIEKEIFGKTLCQRVRLLASGQELFIHLDWNATLQIESLVPLC
jgi:hypothetical protein